MLDGYIDLRSDTVTAITASQRVAMAYAVTGDMLYEDDRYVSELEHRLALWFGVDDCVWMPSCTMANLVALALASSRGDEIIVGATSHINALERKNAASLLGVSYAALPDSNGRLDISDLSSTLAVESEFQPHQSAIALENTHNLAGGRAFHPSYLQTVCAIAGANSLAVHVDGARIFNASVALAVPLAEWFRSAELGSMSLSLSKALGTPAGGALLVRTLDDGRRARRHRKALGGTMHTGAGYLASAALAIVQ
jgi:threonine aldolase